MARPLTLHEKISIKGGLARMGVPRTILVNLIMSEASWLYWVCCGKPVSMFNNPKLWHKKPVRSNLDRRTV